MCAKPLQSLLVTLSTHSPPGSSVHGDARGKNTGVGCHALLQGIFPTRGSNPSLLHYRLILYHLSHQGSLLSDINVSILVKKLYVKILNTDGTSARPGWPSKHEWWLYASSLRCVLPDPQPLTPLTSTQWPLASDPQPRTPSRHAMQLWYPSH